MTNPSGAYLPADRRLAMIQGVTVPEHAEGAVLFADISGFTPLTEALATALGRSRGAELLTLTLNRVYQALIDEIDRFGGSVIGFAGDAITCWFPAAPFRAGAAPAELPDDGALTAVVGCAITCATAIHRAMARFAAAEVAPGVTAAMSVKVAIAAGGVHRFLVGDPDVQCIDVLAGAPLEAMAAAEQQAAAGEIVLDPAAAALATAGAAPVVSGRWRSEVDPRGARSSAYGVQALLRATPPPATPFVGPEQVNAGDPAVRRWLIPGVAQRLAEQQFRFLAELRPATALFLRFAGLDFEQDSAAGAKLDRYIRRVQAIIARYEGALIQLTTGDKGAYLYAAFGAPLTHDDDPQRAVAAAKELSALKLEDDDEHSQPSIQIGISQGLMRVGAYGSTTRQTYGVLGDETNMAARLMVQAEAGQIIVSKRVADLVAGQFHLVALGRRHLKGKREAQEIFAVAAARRSAGGQLATFDQQTLFGRQAELAALAALVTRVQAGEGVLAVIEGEAGYGKSHLTAAVARLAEEAGLQLIVAGSQSTAQRIAYFAARPLVRALIGLAPEEGAQLAEIDQLRAVLAADSRRWAERAPLLGDVLGLPVPETPFSRGLTPRLRQQATADLIVELVRRRAQTRPLLLVLEDAHWLDEPTAAIAALLARTVAAAPVLLLVVTRPVSAGNNTGAGAFSEEWTTADPALRLVLGELAPAESAALMADRLGGPVDPLPAELIHTHAQGNPFFTEELTGALQEGGRLVERDGRWVLAETVELQLIAEHCLRWRDGRWHVVADAARIGAHLGLPDSIHGVVLARLDRLPEAAKLTLKVASVIGRLFEHELLLRAHPALPPAAEMERQMAIFESREFARLESRHPGPVYLFKHNITQEAVYRTLLASQQQELHEAVARALQGLQPEAVDRLAFHFRLADLQQAENRSLALDYLERAAHRAQREYANATALAWFQQALELEVRWPWLLGKVQALHLLGMRDEEAEALAQLEAQPAAPPALAPALRGRYYEAISEFALAELAVAAALAAHRTSGDRAGEARILAQQGQIALRQGDATAAQGHYRAALAVAVAAEPVARQEEADARFGLGVVLRQQGDYGAAEKELQVALQRYRTLNRREDEAKCLTALGGVDYLRRDFGSAEQRWRQALAIRSEISDRLGEGSSLLNVAQVLRVRGDYSEVPALLERALAIQRVAKNRWWEVRVLNELGIVALLLGDWADARRRFAEGEQLATAIGDEGGLALLLLNAGQAARESGSAGEAEQLLQQSLALAQTQEDRDLAAQALSELACTALAQEAYDVALERAEQALALFREMDATVSQTADLTVAALALSAMGRMDEARTNAAAALAILERCGGEGPDYPHRDYWRAAQVLAAAGDQAGAAHALGRAQTLLAAAAERIADPVIRERFLRQVPWNRAIMLA